MSQKVITRFAPSPTGFLHIGNARTALFNYLFARHHGGEFHLRIEDTDRERSTKEAIDVILEGMDWLGLDYDGEAIYQFARSDIHSMQAKSLVDEGKAYYCFMSQDEIAKERDAARAAKRHYIVNSPWRDADPSTHPEGIKPVIRLKAPREGDTIIEDLIQGVVKVANDHLDDMILLRSDGTPTYMLSVVVDDHDMGVTHIIRGDDHLTNAARQILLYQAFGWDVPKMAHMPLIHGPDGAKLSKRHGALSVRDYKEMGYLAEAMCNYLLRLGWSHGDDEIISKKQAIEWFNIEGIGKGPARLDFDKMKHVNSIYLREMDNKILCDYLGNVSEESKAAIVKAMDSIKSRCNLIPEIIELAKIYEIGKDLDITPEAKEIIDATSKDLISNVINLIENTETLENISDILKEYAKNNDMKVGELMKPLRAILTGQVNSPSVFEIIQIIGKEETIRRLKRA